MTVLLQMFVVTFVVFMVIDLIWLGVVARKLYNEQLGYLMKKKVNWFAAIVFYVIFVLGMIYFVIEPGLAADSLQLVLVSGLLFGFVTYATYDLTNLATTKDWPVLITVVDLMWGSFLSASTSVVSFLILRSLL